MNEALIRVATILTVNLLFTFLNFCLLIGIRYKTYKIEKTLNKSEEEET